MTRTSLLVAAGAFALAGAASAQSVSEQTGVNSALGTAPSTADFVTELANGDMFEIESSKLAVDKGIAADKSFAGEMVTAHEKTSADVKKLVDSGAVQATLPNVIDSSHQKKLDDLKALNGENFAKQYKSDQVSAHKDAISVLQRYAKNGDNPKLKDWAATTLPTVEQHLKMAQNLKG